MANLSGEYDLIVEVGVDALNAIMAAVHANQDPGYPRMPHSLSFFLDDTNRGPGDPIPAAERTGIRSRVEVQVSTPTLSLPVDPLTVRPDVIALARRLAGPEAPEPEGMTDTGPGVVRWPPRWTQPSVPAITAATRMRAWIRDTTDPALPSFVDGDLVVTTALIRTDVPGVSMFMTLERTSGPTVTFRPSAGTSITPDQASAIARAVRNVIRLSDEPPTFRVQLPQEVRSVDLELQPQARRPSVVLMAVVDPETTPGPNARASVAGGLLPDGADFAIGVGRDHVIEEMGRLLAPSLTGTQSFSKWGVSAKLTPDPDSVSFDLQPGRLVVSLRGDGRISALGMVDHFTFSVRVYLGLVLVGGEIQVVPDGDPVVSLVDVAVGGNYIEGKAREGVAKARDATLKDEDNAAALKEAFDVAKHLESVLSGINPNPPDVTLTGVEVRPDGVLVSGTIGLAVTVPVVAGQMGRDGFNDGLPSWIPGGTVERLVWERYPAPPDTRVEEHRFVTEAITGRLRGGICLRVEGTRVTPGGGTVPISGSACFPFAPYLQPFGELSIAPERPLLPLPEPTPDGRVRVVGHYDPWATGRVPAGGHGSLLVHAGTDPADVAGLLGDALGARKGGGAVLAVGVIRADEESDRRQTGAPDAPTIGPEGVVLVDDADGSWTDAFGLSNGTGTVLVGPRGDVVWQGKDSTTAKQLARALDQHAKEGGEDGQIATQPITLTVRTGNRPPDVPIRLLDGSELSLRRLKGRGVVLSFWTSRSGPSVEHLELLREVAGDGGPDAPLVIAVGDGETWDGVATLLEERRFPYLVVADADRLLGRSFGVWAWPVTVWIRPDQRIEAIDIGASHPGPHGSPKSR